MSTIPSHIFRGYDIRAIGDEELTNETVVAIAKAYATFLLRRRICETILGYDNRLTSDRIRSTATKALIESGINVIDIGLSLTQIVYYSQYHFRSKGAMMITASHNPKEYNGFKLGVGFSDTLISEEIQEIREIAQSGKFTHGKKPGIHTKHDIFNSYKEDLFKRVQLTKQFHVVVDSCNGATGKFLPIILREAGCQVTEQNTKLDGNFPSGTADPTESEVLNRLSEGVIKAKADLGFAYDADGDRIGIVDENGRTIWNDVLVALMAKDILSYLPGAPIIYNTLCSKAVSDVIKKEKGQDVVWKTGHSFIKAKVKEIRSPFGGELSGHFFFMDNFYGHDDGAFTSLRLLQFLENTNQTLGEALDSIPKYHSSPEIKFGLADDIKFEFVQNILGKALKDLYPDADFLEIDGVRIDTENEMATIRASQNGPYITVKFEARTKENYELLKKQIKTILSSHKEVDFSSGVNTNALD